MTEQDTHVLKLQIPAHKESDMQPQADAATQKLYADTLPAVVQIKTPTGSGSGFFFDKDGHIATDAHVVLGDSQIDIITADGKILPAKIDRLDDLRDVAILKTDGPTPTDINVPKLNDAKIAPDQLVWALGHPNGWADTYISPGYCQYATNPYSVLYLEGTAAVKQAQERLGLLTPKESQDAKTSLNRQVESCQAHVEPGNSGGPVIDKDGAVVGLTDMADESGTAVITPISYLQDLMKQTPKFSFTYKFIEADKLKHSVAPNGEYILIDRSRTDGEVRAPYQDKIFEGSKWWQQKATAKE